MGPLGEKANRVQQFYKDAPANPTRPAGKIVGLYLSASQAVTSGEGSCPCTKEFYGGTVGEAILAASEWIKAKLPGYTL